MKTTIENQDKKELPFPKLMIYESTDLIVYFTESGLGTLLNNSRHGDFMKETEGWCMGGYTDFNGKLILEND